jgi:hypothetical protein
MKKETEMHRMAQVDRTEAHFVSEFNGKNEKGKRSKKLSE